MAEYTTLPYVIRYYGPNNSNIDYWYGPYNSLDDALTQTETIHIYDETYIIRYVGMTVGILNENGSSITEYWFKNGIEDEDLIPKVPDIVFPTIDELLGNIRIIKFNANGGAGHQNSELTDAAGWIHLPEPTFTNENGTFSGWGTTNGDQNPKQPNTNFDCLANNGTNIFYAIWSDTVSYSVSWRPDVDGCTVTCTANGDEISRGDMVSSGSIIVFTCQPHTGYQFSQWYNLPQYFTTSDNTATGEIQSNIADVWSSVSQIYFVIELTNGTGYTISATYTTPDITTPQQIISGQTQIPYGATVVFTYTLLDDYVFNGWTGLIGATTSGNTATIASLTSNLTVGCNVSEVVIPTYSVGWNNESGQYTIECKCGENANSLSPLTENPSDVPEGYYVEFTCIPETGYVLQSWNGFESTSESGNVAVVNQLSSDITASCSVAADEYELRFNPLPQYGTMYYSINNGTPQICNAPIQVQAGANVVVTYSSATHYVAASGGWIVWSGSNMIDSSVSAGMNTVSFIMPPENAKVGVEETQTVYDPIVIEFLDYNDTSIVQVELPGPSATFGYALATSDYTSAISNNPPTHQQGLQWTGGWTFDETPPQYQIDNDYVLNSGEYRVKPYYIINTTQCTITAQVQPADMYAGCIVSGLGQYNNNNDGRAQASVTYGTQQNISIQLHVGNTIVSVVDELGQPVPVLENNTPVALPQSSTSATSVRSFFIKFTVTEDKTFYITLQPNNGFEVTTSSDPEEGGTTSGDGYYDYNDSLTVTATPSTGYNFVNWTENETEVSTSDSYQFQVTSNRILVANFEEQLQSYTVAVSANDSSYGTVSGGGTYQQGTSATVTATAASGYHFVNWTENGSQVSIDAQYNFNVTGDRTLVANFAEDVVEDINAIGLSGYMGYANLIQDRINQNTITRETLTITPGELTTVIIPRNDDTVTYFDKIGYSLLLPDGCTLDFNSVKFKDDENTQYASSSSDTISYGLPQDSDHPDTQVYTFTCNNQTYNGYFMRIGVTNPYSVEFIVNNI